MNKTLKTALKTLPFVLIGVVLILAFLLVGVWLRGLQVYTVLSGSMEPNYHTGSLIFVREVDYKDLKVDDVITFALSEDTTATHRIVEIVPDEEDPNVIRYRTKGDANKYEDQTLVHCENVIGTPVFTIPYMGYFVNYIQKPPGMYIAIAVGISLIIFVFAIDLITEDDSKKKKKKKRGQADEVAEEEAPAEEASDSTESEILSEDEKFQLADLDLSGLQFDETQSDSPEEAEE